jgi:16S rRNA processing protein RimM
MNEDVPLAAIIGAHGLQGDVRLKLFAQSVESLRQHKVLNAAGRELTVQSVKEAGPGAIVRFREIANRNAAEALRGTLLTVPRSALPPLEDGEYYHADLLALPWAARDGSAEGTVIAVENFGAGDVLELRLADGRQLMVPFKPGIADVEDGKILVDPEFLI